jgi:hypothetical protein
MLPAVGSLAARGARIVPWRQPANGIINVPGRLTAPPPEPDAQALLRLGGGTSAAVPAMWCNNRQSRRLASRSTARPGASPPRLALVVCDL